MKTSVVSCMRWLGVHPPSVAVEFERHRYRLILHRPVRRFPIAHDQPKGALGRVVEYGNTEDIFTSPQDERTQGYITGRYG